MDKEIEAAKRRLEFPADTPVASCYEIGRDGFSVHRYLVAEGVENPVADSSSIEVSRKARGRKTDRLNAKRLLQLLVRYWPLGEEDAWNVVNVPSRADEDRRQLHRVIGQLIRERTARSNRIESLLATQGVNLKLRDDFPERLRKARLWDGTPLPTDLRARLEREWAWYEAVGEEIRMLEDQREERVEEAEGDAALVKVRRLMQVKGIGLTSAWLHVMKFFAGRDFNNGKEIGALSGLVDPPYQSTKAKKG